MQTQGENVLACIDTCIEPCLHQMTALLSGLANLKGQAVSEFICSLFDFGADLWQGDVTNHFSVKRKGVSVERGGGISE